ncbi:MAG TPA: hypothetical protein VFE60_05740, partial [Roseiarcus sp.]|nr:hypothetical protein [Roseiarcus sp.]
MAGSAETSQVGEESGSRATSRAGFFRRLGLTYRSELALAVAILLIAGVVSFWSPQVFSYGNISNVAQAAAPLVIMSLGVLLVIITSGIDLSVGSTFSLSGMVAGLAMLYQSPESATRARDFRIGKGLIQGGERRRFAMAVPLRADFDAVGVRC